MFNFLIKDLRPYSLEWQLRRTRMRLLAWLLLAIALTGFVGLLMLRFGPKPAMIGWLFYACVLAMILVRPRYGVYLTLFLGLVGDPLLTPWYPFTKNFSSAESIFYLHPRLIISPLEVCLVLTLISWLLRSGVQRKLKIHTGVLFWPAMIFIAFVVMGLFYGLSTGGNLNIALWEARAIFYMPMMLLLTSNLIENRSQLSTLIWLAMIALFIEGINGCLYFLFVLKGSLAGVDAITEHAAAVHMNVLFILMLASWLYRASPSKRFFLPLMALPVILTYLATQRRAAFLSLFFALGMMAVILFFENRRLFFLITPPLAIVVLLYTLAFWNSTSTIALPAQAIKSIVAQEEASLADQSSNIYRILENINTSFTIHQHPFTGVGFGNKFLIVISMPDISVFEWWEYITHNSIAWIWMKTGFFGFFALLYLIGLSVGLGAHALRKMPGGDLSAIAMTALLYLVMHFIYAYVDISWDIQSMLFVGAMMGVVNSIELIAEKDENDQYYPWPWQKPIKRRPPLKSSKGYLSLDHNQSA